MIKIMPNYSMTEAWQDLNKNLEICTKAVSINTVPYEIAPGLRLKLISKLYGCLQKWEKIEALIHPFVAADVRWEFDCVGNILRSSLIDYQSSKLDKTDRKKLSEQLHYAREIGSNLRLELLSFSATSLMNSYTGLENSTKGPSIYFSNRAHSHQGGIDMDKKDATTLLDILSIHRQNSADYRRLLAKDPGDVSSRRRLEDETNSIGKLKKQLTEIGVKIERSAFDDYPSEKTIMSFSKGNKSNISNEGKDLKPKESLKDKQENKIKQTVSKKVSKEHTEVEIEPYSKGDISSMRQSFIDYLGLFRKGIDLNLNPALKDAVETRFEVLLLRVNNLVREKEQNGQDAGYFLDISNLLYMSVKDLHESDASRRGMEISRYLSAAVDLFDVALRE